MSGKGRGNNGVTKEYFVRRVASKTGLTQRQSAHAIEEFVNAVKAVLRLGDPVIMVGFGTFKTYKRPAHVGINPSNGEHISVPDRFFVKFKASDKFFENNMRPSRVKRKQ